MRAFAIGIALSLWTATTLSQSTEIRPGEIWADTDGVHINAHGGGVLYHDGLYYWYGEHKTAGRGGNRASVGVRVYRSSDLVNWENAGVALSVHDEPELGQPASEIVRGCVIERPKVLYNEHTGRFVMWFHLELRGHRYNTARTGVAVADSPTGPFAYLRSVRPNAGRFPIGLSDNTRERIVQRTPRTDQPDRDRSKAERATDFFERDFYGGQMARDMTLFLDSDGTAYHIFASEENYTLHIAELDESFTEHSGKYDRVLIGAHREAPAIFKLGGKYHLFTSGCTGWAPNAAQHAQAESIWGPWEVTGNPCVGNGGDLTFGGQSTFVLPVHGRENAFIFMADIWRPKNPIDGRYLWVPIRFKDGRPELRQLDSWTPSTVWDR